MADCSYSRCIQQRRNIRRELQRWTKNMVHIVGLERIAEELMGRRKWKLYQDSMSRSYHLQPLNNNTKTTNQDIEYIKQESIDIAQQQLQEQESAAELLGHREETGSKNQHEVTERTNEEEEKVEDTTPVLAVEVKQEKIEEKEERERQLEERLSDWTPQTKCYFCVDGKLDSEHIGHGVSSPRHSDTDSTSSHSDTELSPSLTPSAAAARVIHNNHSNRPPPLAHHPAVTPSSMTTLESMVALATVAAMSGANSPAGAPLGAPPHIPFYSPGMLPHNWYLANVAARTIQTDRLHAEVDKGCLSPIGEQPLDLSSKGSSGNGDRGMNNVRLPTLDTKQIFKAKPRMSAVAGRRTYTEDELQAALRDIQSGKLGTRRAAVIYGIPRSTLRNKVYKLAIERERESHLNSVTPLKIESEEAMDDDKELSGAEEEKEVEKALSAPLLSMADIIRFSNTETPPDVLKNILQKNKEGADLWGGLEPTKVAPYLQSLILASQNILTTQKVEPPPLVNNIVPDFMKQMLSDDHLLKEQLKQHQQNNNGEMDRLMRPSPSNSVITRVDKPKSESDMETEDSPSNVILKIPSFKPTTSKNGSDLFRSTLEHGSMVSPPVTSESGSPPILPGKAISMKDVKDVIAHSISQKFQQSLEPPRRPMMEMDFKRSGFTPPGISVIKTQPEQTRPYQHPPKPQTSTTNANASGGKGTRPKRGKYRNYDRDSLVEAVRAVQRGEMSVHRAGSYYGVPHSTLEYKVKERHLMRPRKRDPKPNPVDEKIASLKQNDIRNAQDKMKPVMKPPQKFPPTSPNGMKLPIFEPGMTPLAGYNPPPFPFWAHPGFPHIPLEYNRNPAATFPPNPEYFASQMMQKLQEESSRTIGASNQSIPPTLAKSTRQIAESLIDGGGSNGSFLDGIIRSSLESGVPSAEEKSPKEEKNIAPENMSNKALLDQLCRNSRLTPLLKPMTDVSSPGEDSYTKGSSPLNFSTGPNSAEARMSSSPPSYETNHRDGHSSGVPTIELSNDSNESTSADNRKSHDDELQHKQHTPPARIYLKQELTNPENLKPEMLVRFRDVVMPPSSSTSVASDIEQNGIGEIGSASDND